MRKMELWFVTSNENKLKEVSRFLDRKLSRLDSEIQEIQAIKVRDVIEDKARSAYQLIKKPVLVEDTGLYIKRLNGFPGALIKWVLDSIGNEGMCNMLKGQKDRSAYAETCFCVYDGYAIKTFSGKSRGVITNVPKGVSGFGWDPIFQPDGYAVTFAEMTLEEKNQTSMRGKALAKLKKYLEDQTL